MKSTIRIDLDEENQPLIKIHYVQTDDLRDKFVKRFLEKFGTESCWAKFHYVDTFDQPERDGYKYSLERKAVLIPISENPTELSIESSFMDSAAKEAASKDIHRKTCVSDPNGVLKSKSYKLPSRHQIGDKIWFFDHNDYQDPLDKDTAIIKEGKIFAVKFLEKEIFYDIVMEHEEYTSALIKEIPSANVFREDEFSEEYESPEYYEN